MPGPGGDDFCAAQHVEGDVTVCDALYDTAPLVHLPKSDATRAYAALKADPITNTSAFVTEDGTTYPYTPNFMTDPEYERHALAIYELTLAGGQVKSFRPAITFEESTFVAPFMGQSFEGTIARRVGAGQFAMETSLPIRVEITNETATPANGSEYKAKAVIANLDRAVKASDGSCMPALSSYGAEAPFDAGAKVTLDIGRAPSMHVFGDDEFTISYVVNGTPGGLLMGPTWFRGPLDILNDSLSPSGTYSGTGHGSPGSMPELDLDPATGGGDPCTAP
jgi:hypothetical protein